MDPSDYNTSLQRYLFKVLNFCMKTEIRLLLFMIYSIESKCLIEKQHFDHAEVCCLFMGKSFQVSVLGAILF